MNEWLTYQEAGEKLGILPEPTRKRALRFRWNKTIGNDKKPRTRLPDDYLTTVKPPCPKHHAANGGQTAAKVILALEGHVATLKKGEVSAERDWGAKALEDFDKEWGRATKAIDKFSRLIVEF